MNALNPISPRPIGNTTYGSSGAGTNGNLMTGGMGGFGPGVGYGQLPNHPPPAMPGNRPGYTPANHGNMMPGWMGYLSWIQQMRPQGWFPPRR